MAVKKIYILGESHTRSFCFRRNVYPIFLSSGKAINFQRKGAIIEKITKVLNSGQILKSDILCLYLGEPDSRFQLGYDWYPHYNNVKNKKLRIVKSKVDKQYLDNAVKTYSEILETINNKFGRTIHLIGPTGSYPSATKALLYLNRKIESLCKSRDYLKYVNIFDDTLGNDGKVLSKYLPPKGLVEDPIHLNSKVSDILIDKLFEIESIRKKENFVMSKDHYNSLEVKNKFKMDPKFGSFTLKDV